MKEYKCEHCKKVFDRKSNYMNHMNRKNACDSLIISDKIIEEIKNEEIIESNDKLKNIINIDNKYIKKCLDECKCAYCGNVYTRKNNVISHIKHHCKRVKEIEKERDLIFANLKNIEEAKKFKEEKENLKEEKKKIDEEKEKFNDKKTIEELKEQNKKIEKQNKMILSMFNKLQKEFKKSNTTKTKNSNNTQTISNNNINSNNNNMVNNNQQNITLVGYKNEDLDKLDKSEILAIMKRGFQAPVELTRTIHFNPKYPEFHNIYIPKINERYGMVFTNDKWRLIDKNDLIDDIYENKRDFIIQNLDNFINQLDEFKKKSLKRWLDINDNDDESIITTKEDIKKLLFDNRHLAMDKKRIMDREARKLEIIHLPKKEKPKIQICDVESVSEKSDTESSDSSKYSNYSYLDEGNDSDSVSDSDSYEEKNKR
jgi:hypothetical protein